MAFTVHPLGYAPDTVDYQYAWDLQRTLHAEVRQGTRENTLLLLEHAPVFTAGRRTEDHERPTDGTPVVDVDRGGKITWHGPGQLVAYPIYKLQDPGAVKAYVHQIEQAVIDLCGENGITATRVEGRAGVWLTDPPAAGVPTVPGLPTNDRKIAAIGIRIHEGVAMHGVALNCSNDDSGFSAIVPCGIVDASVTTLSAETGRTVDPVDVADRFAELLITHIAA
ncbi:lipoyl(octanoyl) transferase LipB [Brevibacterium litoralis]|uniref:lipoyl(octanoyl) transferase LipB n=1 Tax=Brevibacterium litoralis TaxID=3138935 RepID=UPI0032EDA0D4